MKHRPGAAWPVPLYGRKLYAYFRANNEIDRGLVPGETLKICHRLKRSARRLEV